jgi:hypothetical protein
VPFAKALVAFHRHKMKRTHADRFITTEMLESVFFKPERDEGHVRGVHRLKAEVILRTIKVGVRHQILDSLYNFLKKCTLQQSRLEHGCAF